MRTVISLFLAVMGVWAQPAPWAWRSVNIQGMGYVTGMVGHPLAPFDIYIRTDVGGAYRLERDSGRWMALNDALGSLESEGYGVESVAVDPTDARVVYMAAARGRTITNGSVFSPAEVFVSRDRGASWTAMGLAAKGLYIGANDAYRGMSGERVAVDPQQPGNVYFASRKNGLWRRAAGGSEWVAVGGGLPATAATPGFQWVVFDVTSGKTEAGSTATLYAGVYGTGVFASTDGGANWTALGGAVNPVRAAVGGDGALYVTFGGDEGGTSGSVRRYAKGAWTDITPLGRYKSYGGVTLDAADAAVVVVAENSNKRIYRSSDGGQTWSQVTVARVDGQPAYYPGYSGDWGCAGLLIDPQNPARLWQTNGYGVIATEDYKAQDAVFSWRMKGLEELVVQKVKVPPVVTLAGSGERGADLFSVVADMVGFRHASRDAVPEATLDKFQWVAQGTSFAYSAGQPEYAAFVGWDETNVAAAMTGYTTDNGKTWSHFADTTPGTGGKIAMAAGDAQNMVWAPHNAKPQYTKDGGRSWKKCQLNGADLPASWQLLNEWWNGDVLVADQVAAATFYYYDNGNLYSSADGGATWALVHNSWPQDPKWTLATNLVPSPVAAGELYLSFSANSNSLMSYRLLHTVDGGKSFETVGSLERGNYVAFGRGETAERPWLYAYGRANGEGSDAVYQSKDSGATWVRITEPRLQQFGTISSLEGDLRVRDLVYVGTGGRGVFYGAGPGSGLVGAAPGAPKNAASRVEGAVAPGELVMVDLGEEGEEGFVDGTVNEWGSLSTLAGGRQVLFDGVPAALLFVAGREAAAFVPYAAAGREAVQVQVGDERGLSMPTAVAVAAVAPGVFAGADGKGQAVAYREDGMRNSAGAPAARGSLLSVYVTGEGVAAGAVTDGEYFGSQVPAVAALCEAKIGGVVAEAVCTVAPQGPAGVARMTVHVPEGAAAGRAVPLQVTVGGVEAQAGVTVAIR